MAQNNYQEPIGKEDMDLMKKFREGGLLGGEKSAVTGESAPSEKSITEIKENVPVPEKETTPEKAVEQVSEKIETARKAIQTQKAATQASVQDDAQTVAGIAEYEKKVEKLVEMALIKGPEHAVRVARHMDSNDNYTLDELHDKMIEDDLRKQLIQKGLLKEL